MRSGARRASRALSDGWESLLLSSSPRKRGPRANAGRGPQDSRFRGNDDEGAFQSRHALGAWVLWWPVRRHTSEALAPFPDQRCVANSPTCEPTPPFMQPRPHLKLIRVAAFLGLACIAGDARAMLVYSYYSDQIIITTDERRSGPVDLPPEVGPSIAACWWAPHPGDQITVQLSFKRDGSLFGEPRINYLKPSGGSSAQALTESILRAIDSCLPLPFTPELAANIAGQVFVIRFVAP
jgi:hypothetical protein